MNLMTKCDEGHFYDKGQNPSGCPFCGVGAPDLTRKAPPDPDDDPVRYTQKAADRTRAYGARPADGEGSPDGPTLALWSLGGGIDPPVGYLICTAGPNQGRDYRIRSGYNNIGRDTSQQICIVGDDTISRVEHAKIFYDPKHATFHVIAGNGRSGIYVNGQVVLQPVALKGYDVLEMGATHLTFLPFCGDRFRWGSGKSADGPLPPPPPPAEPPRSGPGRGSGHAPERDPDLSRGVN